MTSKSCKEISDGVMLSGLTRHRSNLAHLAPSDPFLRPPMNPAGNQYDVSDRLLLCASSNMRNEVVVGSADHALYSVNVNDPNSRPVTMYGKTTGHTDWVTSVTHLPNGKVLSGAMDGKLCLWSERVRSQCIELQCDSMHPISKVISDVRSNIAMSCKYDGRIAVWNFGDEPADGKPEHSMIRSGRAGGATHSPGPVPLSYLSAHTEPVLECAYRGNTFVSGDKAGSMVIWDISRCQAKHRFRAHPGAITGLDCMEDRATVISCGVDGFVKVWDPRTAGSGLVHKIPAHVQQTAAAASSTPLAGRGVVAAGRGRVTAGRSISAGRTSSSLTAGRGRGLTAASAAPSPAGGASAIACMAISSSRGSSTDACYIVTGSGSATDSSLVVIDIRQGFRPVSRWDHHRNGVYSLCIAGDQCVLSGDGMGTLLCHSLLGSELDDPRSCLKYGIGASEQGAVRAIHCLNGKVVTAGEDGKVMVFDYDTGMFAS